MSIPTYIINLESRKDRKENVLKEFEGKPEFSVTLVKAIKHKIGAIGLWHTIKYIIQDLAENEDYALICEDDHQFTEGYSKEVLFESIDSAKQLDADILCGGISSLQTGVQVSVHLFWIGEFTGTQFFIVFKKFYQKILDASFTKFDAADYKISELTSKKFVIHPFISIQKDFGYSDVTNKNNQTGRIVQLFEDASAAIISLKKIAAYFKKFDISELSTDTEIDIGKASISTFIINLPERIERLAHVRKQFENKAEFDIIIIEAIKHDIGAVGLWMSIRKVIELAIKNDDDVILIAEDDHEFTDYYNKQIFLKNIIIAHQLGIHYLSGGCSSYEHVLPVTKNLYWTSSCQASQFIILYKPAFKTILANPYDESVAADLKLSELFPNKMILYPAISTQKDFGYSDVTPIHNKQKKLVTNMFYWTEQKLNTINKMIEKYNLFCIKEKIYN